MIHGTDSEKQPSSETEKRFLKKYSPVSSFILLLSTLHFGCMSALVRRRQPNSWASTFAVYLPESHLWNINVEVPTVAGTRRWFIRSRRSVSAAVTTRWPVVDLWPLHLCNRLSETSGTVWAELHEFLLTEENNKADSPTPTVWLTVHRRDFFWSWITSGSDSDVFTVTTWAHTSRHTSHKCRTSPKWCTGAGQQQL